MTRPEGEEFAPKAHRNARPRWIDIRIIGGVLLLASAVVLGSKIVSSASMTTPKLVATNNLAAGTVVSAADFSVVEVNLGTTATVYIDESSLPANHILSRNIRAGELIPAGAFTVPEDGRIVLVAVAPERMVPGVSHGSVIDLYLVSGRAAVSSDPRQTELLYSGAIVQSISDPASGGLSGAMSAKYHLSLQFSPAEADVLVRQLAEGEPLVVLHSS